MTGAPPVGGLSIWPAAALLRRTANSKAEIKRVCFISESLIVFYSRASVS
jgi:hypothetical protein